MPSVCCYFQVHQPFRLKRFTYFDSSRDFRYFDDKDNGEVFCKVAEKCYLPANRCMLNLIERFQGKFRIAFSISGVAVEQMQRYCPEVLDGFVRMVRTGCVELIGETYHHSLAALYNQNEFFDQVRLHGALMKNVFGVVPQVFRNTELIYDDGIGALAVQLGYKGLMAEGCADVLGGRSPNYVYEHPYSGIPLLLRNFGLSDDVAFRFSNPAWSGYPLNAEKFARSVHELTNSAHTLNLCMDYETFGEHQWATTGIFDFLDAMPAQILANPAWDFATPSEVISRYRPVDKVSFARLTSWADKERDVSAWQGNRVQMSALRTIAELAPRVYERGDPQLTETWRKLQISDHFYYMCTKWFADGDVHAYFSPYDTPYDAFIRYMNVVKDFKKWLSA